jgi:arylsulfatase A-like enzyme
MSPPCTVEFTVGEDEGPVVLRAAAGVDQEAGALRLQSNRWVFGFSVSKRTAAGAETDEFKPIFSTHIETFRDQPMLERFWRRVGGHEGMVLESGETLRLTTWIDGLSAEQAAAQAPLKVGFGELLLEKPSVQPRQPSSPQTPNIVLILQDTQRQDRLSCYGYPKPTTPHIDRLAARGLRFDNAYATASWTWPSTASVLTGLQPEAHGVLDDDACYLAHQLETLPEALQSRGYTTAGFTCNPLIVPQKNFDQGFEFFDCNTVGFRKSEHIVPQVTRWIEEHAGTRFFLYLHLVDPHAPHTPRQENLALLGGHKPESFNGEGAGIADYNGRLLRTEGHSETGVSEPETVVPEDHARWMSDVYDASVGTGDWWVGQVTQQLEALGLADETVVAYTSDHGEEWLDHGLLTHGHAIHKELTLIPLVMAGPGVREGAVETAVTSNRHLASTLAAFGGAHLEQVIDPINLTSPEVADSGPVMFGTHHGWWNGRQRQPIYGTREGPWVLHFAPHGGDWKVPEEEAPLGGQVRLYNLDEDPDEHQDVASAHPEVVERLRASLLARLEEQASRRGTVQLKAGAATLEMLRGIGYLDDGQ